MPKWEHLIWKKLDHKRKGPSTDIEVMNRVALVSQMVIQWYSRAIIVANLMYKYNISESAVDEYLKKAKEIIRTKNEETLEDELELVQARITDTYQGARKEKKWDSCTRAIKLHMELKWLEAPKKIVNYNKDVEMTEEEENDLKRFLSSTKKYKNAV